MNVEGRTVIVAGAARGIGRACATKLARAGADLVLIDLGGIDVPDVPYPLATLDQLNTTAQECEAEGAAILVAPADVRDGQAVRAAVDAGLDRFGAIHALVNCVGIVTPAGNRFDELTEAQWAVHLDINLSGAWRLMSAVTPALVGARNGTIVNLASTAGVVGYPRFAGYVASKHGLIGLTRAAALDLAPYGVSVNAVCPGSVRDDDEVEGTMLAAIAAVSGMSSVDQEAVIRAQQPTAELVEVDEVASVVASMVASATPSWTGAVVTVDGGYSAR